MATRRRAELLIPSPLGLVIYDLLEEAAYLGPSARGGLHAAPDAFPEAVALVAVVGSGFEARALPGEPPVVVNGEKAAAAPLPDGACLEIAGQIVTFRTVSPPIGEPATRAARPSRRVPPPSHRPWWVSAMGLAGGLLLLAAGALAVQMLIGIRSDEEVTVRVPSPVPIRDRTVRASDPAGEDYDRIAAWEKANPDDAEGAVARWQEFLKRWTGSPHADRARSRIHERIDDAAKKAVARLDEELGTLLGKRRFNTALERIRELERRYGATEEAAAIEGLRRKTREAARVALDALLARLGPRVATDPRNTHRELLEAGADFPPDLAGEITDLLERASQLLRSRGVHEAPRPPRAPATDGPGATGGPEPLPPVGPTEGPDAEKAAHGQWARAREDLGNGRYQDAFEGYTLLVMRYAKTDLVKANTRAINAGRYAAQVGVQGPVAMLSVPAQVHHGRIEVDYDFYDSRVLERDFSIEQPFASEQPIRTRTENGEVHLEGTSGLLHFMVWESDVTIQADVEIEVAHDVGALAVEDADTFRAIVLSLGNTRFKLKKGDAARANPGHVLWFMGQGVWADADPDAIGYIKIAERPGGKLQGGDRGTIELVRKGARCEAGFHGRGEDVTLKGTVTGDDGGTMGSARVGLFANTGALVVKHVRIVGKVDEQWFRTRLGYLVQEDPGPKE